MSNVTQVSSSKLIELVKNELKNKSNVNHTHTFSDLVIPIRHETGADEYTDVDVIDNDELLNHMGLSLDGLNKIVKYNYSNTSTDYFEIIDLYITIINRFSSKVIFDNFYINIQALFTNKVVYTNYSANNFPVGITNLNMSVNNGRYKLYKGWVYVIFLTINDTIISKIIYIPNYFNLDILKIYIELNPKGDHVSYENYNINIYYELIDS